MTVCINEDSDGKSLTTGKKFIEWLTREMVSELPLCEYRHSLYLMPYMWNGFRELGLGIELQHFEGTN